MSINIQHNPEVESSKTSGKVMQKSATQIRRHRSIIFSSEAPPNRPSRKSGGKWKNFGRKMNAAEKGERKK